MPEKAAIYCRISIEDGKDTESESIHNQKILLTEYAKKKHWDIFDIYCDENYSGMDDNRPDFIRMIKDAQKGCFSVILCKTQSRFTRNIITAEKYLHHQFLLWGIRFVTLIDGTDSFQKQSKKIMRMNSLINEWYCEELSENIRKVFHQKQIQGQFLGNYAPYGYQKSQTDKHKLEIDPNTAAIVHYIFQQYAIYHKSYSKIAETLTNNKIPTPAQYKAMQGKDTGRKVKQKGVWSCSSIRRILHNPVYIGHMVQNKETKINYKSKKVVAVPPKNWVVVYHTHEAIICTKLFLLCNQKRNQTVKKQKNIEG